MYVNLENLGWDLFSDQTCVISQFVGIILRNC